MHTAGREEREGSFSWPDKKAERRLGQGIREEEAKIAANAAPSLGRGGSTCWRDLLKEAAWRL